MNPVSKSILKEVIVCWLVVILIGKAAMMAGHQVPFLSDYSGLILSALLIYVPLFVFIRQKRKIDFIPFDARSLGVAAQIFGLMALLIFSVSFIVVGVTPGLAIIKQPFTEIIYFFIYQMVVVAFPEEFFFRGYMQERLNDYFGKKFNLMGTPFGHSLWVTSLVFALSHSIMAFQPWHILIFFPSLVFGMLREKTGSIWASILFHATSNLFSFCVVVKYPLF